LDHRNGLHSKPGRSGRGNRQGQARRFAID
jgi:hypothetical protein